MTAFKDHFSSRSEGYALYRPTYPDALYEWLAARAPARQTAWDCGTGNGQAARGLSLHFARVIATDGSVAQLAQAAARDNVEYRAATAEESGLDAASVDLVTVAQALHWFDRPRFFTEARRVARVGAILAIWMYNRAAIDREVDEIVLRFYTETVGPYWPDDRVLIDSEYRTIELPFPEIAVPNFAMEAEWTLQRFLGYLRTWSAVTRYVQDKGHDPVALVEADLERAWGGRAAPRRIHWPLIVRAAQL